MPRYAYVAHDRKGNQCSGEIGAANRRDALGALIRRDLTPAQIREQIRSGADSQQQLKPHEIESLFQMLSDLLAAGIPLAKAMDILCHRSTSPAMRLVAESLRDGLSDGDSLASTMEQHPEVFRPIVLSLVRSGEQTGLLEQSLAQIAELTRREQELRGRVMGALAYPTFLLVVGAIVTLGMIAFFVPRFEPLFARMQTRGELPIATTLLLGFSRFLQANSGAVLVGLACLAALFVGTTGRGIGRQHLSSLLARLPLVGPLTTDISFSRFARTLGTMLQSGVPVVKSLEVARHTIANPELAEIVLQSSRNLQSGGSLTDALRTSSLVPIEITEMIAVGEQTNRLEHVFLSIAENLDTRSKRQLDMIVKLIEPLMMVVMAGLIGFLIVALLLPVFNSTGRFY